MIKVVLSTSILFLMIAADRKFFREKGGSVFIYSLWLLFAAGLVVPVFSAVLQDVTEGEKGRVESPISIMNLVKTIQLNAGRADIPAQQMEGTAGKGTEWGQQAENTEKGTEWKQQAVNTGKQLEKEDSADSNTAEELAGSNGFFKYILFFIWAAGAVMILLCQFFSEKSLRRQLVENRQEISYQGQKAYMAKGINTPLLFRSRGLSSDIYLPETIMGNETLVRHAMLHENIHRKHGDIWWGYVRNFLTAIYWFYPLVWAAAVLSKRDCEYACDSSVMKNMSREERISYGNSLLSLIQAGGNQDLFSAAAAMKIGKSEMEVRIRMIKSGRKRSIFAVVFILFLVCVTGTAAFTDAKETGQEPVKC